MAGKKKKVNPNRIPVSQKSLSVEDEVTRITMSMTYRGWLIMIGALSDFYETTGDEMLALWNEVNAYAGTVRSFEGTEHYLKKLETLTGLSIPFEKVTFSGISSQGELNRFRRRVERNAVYSAIAIIAEPMVEKKMYSEEKLCEVIKRALSLNEEIDDRSISEDDILGVLRDDLGIELVRSETNARLRSIVVHEC